MKLVVTFLSLAVLAIPALAISVDSVATPEPATIALLGTGLASIGIIAWRRSRKK